MMPPLAVILALTTLCGAQGSHVPGGLAGPTEIYPNRRMTPGATNPDITQNNISETICSRRWSTRSIRPPASYTNRLKKQQMIEYGDTVMQTRAELVNPTTGKVDFHRCVPNSNSKACYEEDHLIPLEIGGAPRDPNNLWPEPFNTQVNGVVIGAHEKDVVEGFVHDEICYGIPYSKRNSHIEATASIPLKRGQEILARDWYACYASIKKGEPCK